MTPSVTAGRDPRGSFGASLAALIEGLPLHRLPGIREDGPEGRACVVVQSVEAALVRRAVGSTLSQFGCVVGRARRWAGASASRNARPGSEDDGKRHSECRRQSARRMPRGRRRSLRRQSRPHCLHEEAVVIGARHPRAFSKPSAATVSGYALGRFPARSSTRASLRGSPVCASQTRMPGSSVRIPLHSVKRRRR
jgi:hypothetical protein